MANNQSRDYSMNNGHNYATITSSIGSSRYEPDDVHRFRVQKMNAKTQNENVKKLYKLNAVKLFQDRSGK